MTTSDIIKHRLAHQQIYKTAFTRPDEIVGWLGEMQAHKYLLPNGQSAFPGLVLKMRRGKCN